MAMHCATLRPLRGSVFTAFSSSRISGGKRLAKSAQAVSAQAGWRWPTANTCSFMDGACWRPLALPRATLLRAPVLRAGAFGRSALRGAAGRLAAARFFGAALAGGRAVGLVAAR